jgi:uroporphyrinogen-III decarboxylase
MAHRNDAAAAVQQTKPALTIVGCTINTVTLWHGSPSAIRSEVEANAQSGIRIVSPGTALPASVPGKNLRCFTEAVHRLCTA